MSLDPGRSRFERAYAWLLGAPANGLRIRLRRVLPATDCGPQRILDAGSGGGVFSFELAKRHSDAQVVGVELEQDLVDRTNAMVHRAGRTNLTFEQGDVTQLAFDSEFDLVVSVDNLEHIEDDVAAMACLFRALRPGGRLVNHVPGYERRWFVFGRRVNFDVPGHMRPGYRPNEIVDRLKSVGFEIESSHHTYGIIETFTNNVSYTISGADQRRKVLYALAFPFLLALSALGSRARPKWGAGVLTVAHRPAQQDAIGSA